MNHFAMPCTTDSHQLYGIFMGRLSRCIFEWSRDNLQALKSAKRSELVSHHMDDPSEEDVLQRLTKKEFALHCRQRTRGAEVTTKLIRELLDASGDQGLDTLGVPLLDKEHVWCIWESQKHHIACIQRPWWFPPVHPDRFLDEGGCEIAHLPESFHLHLKSFIPGKWSLCYCCFSNT